MKQFLAFILLFTFLGCSKNPETFIKHIDGYWEIEKVVLSNGKTHDYNINLTIDYLSINDSLNGFRKKLKPNFSGTFETSKNQENFKLIIENDSLNIYYKTPFASWKETILNANEQQLKIINQNKDIYLYKRYVPLNLN